MAFSDIDNTSGDVGGEVNEVESKDSDYGDGDGVNDFDDTYNEMNSGNETMEYNNGQEGDEPPAEERNENLATTDDTRYNELEDFDDSYENMPNQDVQIPQESGNDDVQSNMNTEESVNDELSDFDDSAEGSKGNEGTSDVKTDNTEGNVSKTETPMEGATESDSGNVEGTEAATGNETAENKGEKSDKPVDTPAEGAEAESNSVEDADPAVSDDVTETIESEDTSRKSEVAEGSTEGGAESDSGNVEETEAATGNETAENKGEGSDKPVDTPAEGAEAEGNPVEDVEPAASDDVTETIESEDTSRKGEVAEGSTEGGAEIDSGNAEGTEAESNPVEDADPAASDDATETSEEKDTSGKDEVTDGVTENATESNSDDAEGTDATTDGETAQDGVNESDKTDDTSDEDTETESNSEEDADPAVNNDVTETAEAENTDKKTAEVDDGATEDATESNSDNAEDTDGETAQDGVNESDKTDDTPAEGTEAESNSVEDADPAVNNDVTETAEAENTDKKTAEVDDGATEDATESNSNNAEGTDGETAQDEVNESDKTDDTPAEGTEAESNLVEDADPAVNNDTTETSEEKDTSRKDEVTDGTTEDATESNSDNAEGTDGKTAQDEVNESDKTDDMPTEGAEAESNSVEDADSAVSDDATETESENTGKKVDEVADGATEDVTESNSDNTEGTDATTGSETAENKVEESDKPVDTPSEGAESESTDKKADASEASTVDNGFDNTEQNAYYALFDYMNKHDYGPDDFATYSQDPEWRALQREAFPNYELPPLSQENAYNQLFDYMNTHNYGPDDFETYSQDPAWRELQSAAFPDYELPPLKSKEYSSTFENVSYNQGQNDFGARGTCGPTSIANSLNRITGTADYTENAVLHNAMDNNLCSKSWNPNAMGGTTTENVVSIIDNVKSPESNIHTEVYEYDNALSVDELADRLDNPGTVAMVGVDSATLWDLRGDVTSSGLFQHTEAPSDHWITVDSPIRDADGNVTGFNIIDSGGGVSYVDRDKFEAMYLGNAEHTISDPTAIIISNQGEASNTYVPSEGAERSVNYKGSAKESDGGDPPNELSAYNEFKSLSVEEQIEKFSNMSSEDIYDMVKNSTESWCVDGYDKVTPDNAKDFIVLNVNGKGETSFNLDWPKYGGYNPETISSISDLNGKVEVSRVGGDGGYTMGLGRNEDGSYDNNSMRSIPKSSAEVNTGTFDVDRYKESVDIVSSDASDEEKTAKLMDMGFDEDSADNMLRDYENWKSRPEIVGEGNIEQGAKMANLDGQIDMKYGVHGKAAEWDIGGVHMEGGAGQMNTVYSWRTCREAGIITNCGKARIN